LTRLGGALPPATRFPDGLTRRLLPAPADSGEAAAFGSRLGQLGSLAGLPQPSDRLASLDRRELQRYLASLFDLATDARLFVAAEDLPYLLQQPPPGWSEDDLRLAAYLVKSGLFAAPLDRPLAGADEEELLLRLAIYLGVLEEREVSFRAIAAGKLRVADADGEREIVLPAELATFRELAGRSDADGHAQRRPGAGGGRPATALRARRRSGGGRADRQSRGCGLRPHQQPLLVDAVPQRQRAGSAGQGALPRYRFF
jgi:hypothetical protein